jgi:hypothetical protein
MNEQLIKFIELCLVDGVISDKEREVIFRKSKELGVPDDECEILIDSLVSKHSRGSNQSVKPNKKGGFFSSMFNEIKNNIDTESIKSSLNKAKEDFQKGMDNSMGNEKSKGGFNEKSIHSDISSQTTKFENNQKDNNDPLNDLKSILDPSKNFDDSFEIIRHIKMRFKESPNYYDVHGVRELIKPKMFGTNIWNSTIREQLIQMESTPQGKLLPLGNVSYKGTMIKRELLFGIIDGEEGILFFAPVNYSPLKKGFQGNLNHPEIRVINGKKELRRGKPGYSWDKIIREIEFGTFRNYTKMYSAGTQIMFNHRDLSFTFQDNDIKYDLSFNSHHINNILTYIEKMFNKGILKERDENLRQKNDDQKKRSKEVGSLKQSLFSRIDKDNNGRIDIFEGDNEFDTLLRKNKDKIQDSGDKYVQSFIRITNYLNTKRSNINGLYEQIRSYNVYKQGQNFDLKDSIGYLENQVHLWNLLFFHSVNMLDSLVRNDKITFYEIYEKFDKLEIFNSNWENEVSGQLKNIEEGIGNLIRKIQQMESNLILELQEMSYMNNKSIDNLNHSVTQSLQSINSSVNFNNLLTGINTYQLYKINKNTKSLRG